MGEEVQSSGKSKSSVASAAGEAVPMHVVSGRPQYTGIHTLVPAPPPARVCSNGSGGSADAPPRRREEGQPDSRRHRRSRSPRRRDQKEKEHRADRARVLLPGGVSP
jgi:hypothetical protein